MGKGVSARAAQHLLKPDATSKGREIAEIKSSGKKVLVSILVHDLTEVQAIKLEAELIAALGIATNADLFKH